MKGVYPFQPRETCNHRNMEIGSIVRRGDPSSLAIDVLQMIQKERSE